MATSKIKRSFGTTRIIVIGFLTIILIGTALLMLPISSADATPTGFLDALFTVVSSSCVTGLTVVDTATHWSAFGHTVILLLIQVGGLGFMTMAVLLSLLIKRAITPKERMLLAASYNLESYDSTMQIVKRVAIGTFAFEFVGALILATRFIPDFGLASGIYKSIFHSVSAFCNAGFDIVGVGNPKISGMSYYAGDPVINLTFGLLIIIGGVGFIVWSDLVNFTTKRKRISVYSQFVLVITLILIVIGTVAFAIFEWNNPQTLGALDGTSQKLIASFFQSSTWRTAGFATMHNGAFTQGSLLLGIILMFIGGASGSTAGGVKVGSVGVLVYTVWCNAIGKKRTIFRSRTISTESFVRAVTVICVQIAAVLVGVVILNANAGQDIMSILYEVVSAISTVGVTMGITTSLPALSKITLCCLMFFGRVGILTVALAVMRNQSGSEPNVKYPEAKMLIG
ncbi:MAG: Trk family potassium uptake protein [Ruminococcaceae bacterium]|nr:Trk family potassium uptake protein [Oscillospiraceae bacterium]